VRVAIVSFLFNWPSAGGGIVHTVELAQFLGRAGYTVRHFYAQYAAWEIGRVEGELPFESEGLEFDEAGWSVEAIQGRFRHAVEGFDPDYVIITDSWNMKPLLAEAVRKYPYLLRFQAMECLCPLNGVRLLPDGERGFRQCQRHQLASPEACCRCLAERGSLSGNLHQAERGLCGVGSREYHERLMRALREAEAVLVVNPLHEAMISPYTDRVRVVTAGMDPARFAARDEGGGARGEGKKTLTIFQAGLVDEAMKGFHVLHAACERLWRERKDFELVTTGDPPGRVDEFTRFVGWLSQAELPRHLREADIVVVPTIAQEALGRTAVEGMAAGRPVVASRIGGLPFTVLEGSTGLLCEPGDVEDLARKIAVLLDDAELRERMGKAGQGRFEQHYSWEVIIERHYKPLLKDKRSGRVERNGYVPFLPDRVDHERLIEDVSEFFGLGKQEVVERFNAYRRVHETKGYGWRLGERKTLCFEEAFILYVVLDAFRPAMLVEIGTQHGKSTRRLLDIKAALGLESRVVCFDVADNVEHFSRDEAELMVRDVTGRFRKEVLEAYPAGVIFSDVHAYGLLKEVVTETLAGPSKWVLAIHDCGRGLCNPHMTIARGDGNVTSSTGVWERHVLAELFGIGDPLDKRLDRVETATHRTAIFETPHGLGVIVPK
jgi:glycosyltransferase involved in cell wall biosynthesis